MPFIHYENSLPGDKTYIKKTAHLNIGSVPLAIVPGGCHRGKHPRGVVKFPPLQGQELGGEGLLQETNQM